MRIRTTKRISKRKSGLLLASAAVVGIVGYGAYSAYYHQWPFTDSPSSTIDSGETKSEDTRDHTDTINQPGKITSPKTPVDSSPKDNGSPANVYDELGVSITHVSKMSGKIRINTLIEAVTDKGTCILKLTKGAEEVRKTAGIQPLASSSTCKGFDIPLSELSDGTWKIILTVTTGNLVGTATSEVSKP